MSLVGRMRLCALFIFAAIFTFHTGCSQDNPEGSGDALSQERRGEPEGVRVGSDRSQEFSCTVDTDCPDDDLCTQALCSSSGICAYKPLVGLECEDGNCCTREDECRLCISGDCPQSGLECRGESQDCDDDDPCTLNECTCEPGSRAGSCSNTPKKNGSACVYSDSDCTTGDQCLDGVCVPGIALELDDKNPCTLDRCIEGAPSHTPIANAPCDDGDQCTIDDRCVLGTCTGGAPLECVQPECAESISCIPGEGCVPVWKEEGTLCNDFIDCTLDDRCNSKHECRGDSTGYCDDENPCTADSCDLELKECRHTPIEGDCEDGDPCTTDSSCIEGVCKGAAIDCSYLDNQCIKGLCSDGECLTSPSLCDDGDPCTEGECNLLTGACSYINSESDCDDGDPCTEEDTCADGSCAGSAIDCSAVDTECLQGYCQDGVCLTETTGNCLDGDTCEDPINFGDSGGTVSANLCDYAQDYSYAWCDMKGPELIIQLKAKYKQGKLLVNKGNSFSQMVWNYRFLGDCDSEQIGYCYAPDNQGAPGWGGYNPDTDLYIAIGSADGSCGIVDFTVQAVCNAGCSKNQICTPQGNCCEPGTLCTPKGECCGQDEICVDEECLPSP